MRIWIASSLGASTWLAVASLTVALVAEAMPPSHARKVVRGTREGPVVGTSEVLPDGGRMNVWRGIPYASAPVGDLRFKAPQPPERRRGLYDATEFGDACPQSPTEVFAIQNTNPGTGVSEDCLNLSIFAPARGGQRPVMVWIHGGGLTTGAGNQSGDDPERLVQEGVVVVTINYRLGILGFLAHPALSATSITGEPGSGDYGLLDQLRALEWLKENIAAFGGDPANVTLFGQSAGAFSIRGLMAATGSESLFDKVILQSGPIVQPQEPLAVAEARGAEALAALCPAEASEQAAECLRSLSATEILQAQIGTDFDARITRRPGVLDQDIPVALAVGSFTGNAVLDGTTLDEWRLFVVAEELVTGRPPLDSLITTEEGYRNELKRRYGFVTDANIDAVAAAYPLDAFDTVDIAVAAVGTDAIFVCPNLVNVRAVARHVPTFAYEFADRAAPPLIPSGGALPLGAAHASDIQYILDPAAEVAADFSADSAALAQAMVRHWATFAKQGDPNPASGDLPEWGPFLSQGYQSLETPEPRSPANVDLNHNCSSLWLAGSGG